MKNASTKRSLLISVVALVLCFAMLLGTTLAWFTDEVTSTGNKIQAGTLKMDLLLLDKESGTWNSIKENKAPIFDYDLWEPGYVDVKVLQVKNLGDLSLKWMATFESETQLSILTDVIDVYVCPSASELSYPTDRELNGYTFVGNLTQFINTLQQTTNGTLEAKQSAYLGIALKMRETAGNEYQGLSIGGKFDIRISATQWTGENEKDSFDNQYDKEATYPALFDRLELEAAVAGKVDADNKLTEEIVLRDSDYGVVVTIPVGTLLSDGVEGLKLKINKDDVNANVTLDQTVGYDVVIEGVAEGNTAPITVLMPRVMPKGQTAIQLYHDGALMERVYTAEELVGKNGNNDTYGDKFLYEAETGNVTFSLTHFSNVSMGSTTKVMVMGKEIVGIEIDLSNPGEYLVDGKITIPADGNVYVISHTRTDTTTKNELSSTLTHSWHNINPGEMCTNSIVMQKGAKVVLNGVNIRNSADDALRIEPSNRSAQTYIYVADGTQNWLTGRSGIGFGTYVYADVYVEGYGTLYTTATGWGSPGIGVDAHTEGDGNKMHFNVSFLRSIPMNAAAGIGGGFAGQSWRGLALVEINGGTYQCYRGGDAASIGSGLNGHFGDIVINAGTVYCYTNPWTAYSRDMGRGMYAGSCSGIYVSKDATVYGYSSKTGYGLWVPGDGYVPSNMKQDASVVVTGFEPMASLSVTGPELYSAGDDVDVQSVTLVYKNGTTKVLSASAYVVSSVDMTTGGKKTAVISYKENGNTITVNYAFSVADEFNALVASVKNKTYNLGYQFTEADFNVSAIGSDGSAGSISGYTISADTSTKGEKVITITYTDSKTGKALTATCTVDILNTTLLNINYNEYDGSYHRMWWFGPGNYDVSGWKSYPDILDTVPTNHVGANGEKISGMENQWALIQRKHADAPNKNAGDGVNGLEFYSNNNWYGLTVTDAVPYTTLGINCVIGYDAAVLGFGYYINGDLSTLEYNAPATYHEGEEGYDTYGSYGAAHALTQFSCASFEAGKTYTVTWVIVFEDGIQKLSDWTIKMKAADANDAIYKDTNKPNVNVVVIAGQSNACGASPITQSMIDRYGNANYPNVYIQYKNVYVDNNTVYTASQNQSFEKYQFGIGGFQSEHFGIELGLANYLAGVDETKNEQWYIIKYAPTGSTLGTQWNDDTLNVDGKNMSLTAAMIEYVQSCIDDLDDDYDVQIRSFLWMQGEGDTGFDWLANAYAANEKNLVDRFRNAFAQYATRTVGNVAGSGIAFVNASIAPNPDQKLFDDGGPNNWLYSTVVNTAKLNNCQHWFVPVETGEGSLFGPGIAAGPYPNINTTDYIVNSIYIDTSSLISKYDAWWEHNEYVVATDKTDWAHYSAQSMVDLGLWFGACVGYMDKIDSSVNSGASSNNKATYTITYNANGGTVSPGVVVVTENCTITLHCPTRAGYTFKGWSDGRNTYAAGASYTPTGDVTLTAQWEYTITYPTNATNSITTTVDKTTAASGETVTITFKNTSNQNGNKTVYVTVTDEDGNTLLSRTQIRLNANGSTTKTFTVKNSHVTITVSQY